MAGTGFALPALTAGRVLVVDDVDDQASSAAVLLMYHRFEARTARTAREALAVARTFRPHVVVLDLGLPDADGVDVIGKLRQFSDPPAVVVVTGHTDKARRKLALDAGAAACLLKPTNPDELAEWVIRLRGPVSPV
ncbi:MAG TPA: response regulator [Fimbriiglobus sp.]|nr:response regulator [Fimbriiglobus sp.]